MKRLSDDDVKAGLSSLKGWRREGDFVTKTFEFGEFMEGIEFVRRIAKVAERLDHHPDIHVRYTEVKLLIQTHSAGGITAKDFELAKAIQKVA